MGPMGKVWYLLCRPRTKARGRVDDDEALPVEAGLGPRRPTVKGPRGASQISNSGAMATFAHTADGAGTRNSGMAKRRTDASSVNTMVRARRPRIRPA